MVKDTLNQDLPVIGDKTQQQKAVDELVDTTKHIVLEMVKETSKEFDQRELTDEQKNLLNEWIGSYTAKVVLLRLQVG